MMGNSFIDSVLGVASSFISPVPGDPGYHWRIAFNLAALPDDAFDTLARKAVEGAE